MGSSSGNISAAKIKNAGALSSAKNARSAVKASGPMKSLDTEAGDLSNALQKRLPSNSRVEAFVDKDGYTIDVWVPDGSLSPSRSEIENLVKKQTGRTKDTRVLTHTNDNGSRDITVEVTSTRPWPSDRPKKASTKQSKARAKAARTVMSPEFVEGFKEWYKKASN